MTYESAIFFYIHTKTLTNLENNTDYLFSAKKDDGDKMASATRSNDKRGNFER